jgi:hypothetical protein
MSKKEDAFGQTLVNSITSKSRDAILDVTEKCIITTEDRARLCLKDCVENMETRRAWIAPLGILMTIVVTLVSASFKDWVLPAAVWQSSFIIALILSGIWLVRTLISRPKVITIDEIVKKLKVKES